MARSVVFRGQENCQEVFAFLGMTHSPDEMDHSQVHYEAGGQTVTAMYGDVIARREDGELMAPFSSSNWPAEKG